MAFTGWNVLSPRRLRRALQSRLNLHIARFRRERSKAVYIAVTGSSAKTTTASLLAHILSGVGNVKSQLIHNAMKSTCKTLKRVGASHDYVVLEIGTAGPGDIREMSDLIRPTVGIVTLVGLEHYSAFRSKEAVAAEKGALIEALQPGGIAILNSDDPNVAAMAASSRARLVTFGGGAGADYTCAQMLSARAGRLRLTLHGKLGQLELQTCLMGTHNWLAVSAAVACAIELGVPPAIVVERVATFEPVFGRCSVHQFPGGPTFILDTVKAPYETIGLALETLRQCAATRRRLVLGQISDFAGNPNPKYRDTYRAAAKFADQVIFVGDNAHKSKATQEEIEGGKFVRLHSIEALSAYIKSTAVPGEVILLKSAQSLHLERVMLAWKTTVRCWPDACGVKFDCLKCGSYKRPHSGRYSKKVGVNSSRHPAAVKAAAIGAAAPG
jgi:UDP-N-acetylmuramoyl-tripeptide--D-alanyl-D-alanine ligase